MADERHEWFLNQIFRHRAALYRYLRKFTSGAEDIEDLVQETYVRVYALSYTQAVESPRALLFRIVHNMAVERARRRFDLRSGTPQTESIRNFQVGYRVQTQTLYADVDVFHRTFSGVPFQQFVTTSTGLRNLVFTYGVKSTGLDFVAKWSPIQNLSLGITGNWQDSTYTDIIAASGAGADGNVLQRQPRFQARFTPEYNIPTVWGDLRFFATYSYIGLRYSDPGNAQVLPSFETLDAGIVADIGKHFEIRLQGTNLTNELGITEQDARAASGTSGSSGGFAWAGRSSGARKTSE